MKLNKSSWHYKAWAWTYSPAPPERANLCSYFWRIVLYAPMIAVACGFALAGFFVMGVAYFVIWNAITLLLGQGYVTIVTRRGPDGGSINAHDLGVLNRHRWLKLKYVLPLFWLAFGLYYFNTLLELIPSTGSVGVSLWTIGHGFLVVCGLVLMIVLMLLTFCLVLVVLASISTFFTEVVVPYVKAKKEKVCPLIEFVD